jgi:Fe(3+) dicitrate transport protein
MARAPRPPLRTAAFAALLGGVPAALAAPVDTGTGSPQPDPALLERIVVTSSRTHAREVAGSVHFLDEAVLQQQDYPDINRVLRQVPGLNIVEEEGFGIRPSIGIRGSGTDRNAKIAVMEDGVPIAPAPYSAPSAYYFPRTPRIATIEVSKGPAAIKYGPQTVAGALSMYSTPIPGAPGVDEAGRLRLSGGEFGTWRVHGILGGWTDTRGDTDIGASIETLQERSGGFKDLDSGGDTGFRIGDYVAKLAFRSKAGAERPQSLELKLQYSDEHSHETYLGLTLDDFRDDPYRRYRASQLDDLQVQHSTSQATYRVDFNDRLGLTTLAYYTTTERAWYKLNDVRNATDTGFTSINSILANPAAFPVEHAALVGVPGSTSAPGALRVRNNAREYYAAGIQSVIAIGFDAGRARHAVELSLRYHRDEEDRYQNDDRYQMVDGAMLLTSAGAPGTQDNRLGEAETWAAYVRDTIERGNWTLTPGFRFETIRLRQTNWGGGDPGRDGSGSVLRNTVKAYLPGFGATYALTDELLLVGGLHRGFVNPSPGSEAGAELSWNYEAGLRYERGAGALEAMAFRVNYENLVGTCTASTGGNCSVGDQYDGGAARVHGLELVASYDAGAATDSQLALPLSAVYTWTQGEFETSFSSDFGEWGNVQAGDMLPLVPEHQLALSAGVESGRWRAYLAMNYVAGTRSVAGSGPVPANERIDSRTLFDLRGEFDLGARTSVFASAQNLTNETYNVAFRPAGARPGAPRTVMAGINVEF